MKWERSSSPLELGGGMDNVYTMYGSASCCNSCGFYGRGAPALRPSQVLGGLARVSRGPTRELGVEQGSWILGGTPGLSWPPRPWDHCHPTCQPFHCFKPAPSSGKVWKVLALSPQLLDFTSASPSSLLARGHGFPEPSPAQTAFPSLHCG